MVVPTTNSSNLLFSSFGHTLKSKVCKTHFGIIFKTIFCKDVLKHFFAVCLYASGGSPMKMALIQKCVGSRLRSRLPSQTLRPNAICINNKSDSICQNEQA